MQRDPALTGSSPLAGHGFNRAVAPRPLRPAPPCALEPPRPGDSCSLQGRGGERLRCLPVDLPRLRWKGGRGRAGGGWGSTSVHQPPAFHGGFLPPEELSRG